MWSSGPASHGQFSGNGCREQVMTRQPAAENRLTVAWPMPRLAPVRSNVRRGWLLVAMLVILNSRVKPRLGPWRGQVRTRERNTVVQAEWPLLPKLDLLRHDAIAGPKRRPRHGTDGKFRGAEGDILFKRQPALQRRGLFARPGADLCHARARCEIGVGLFLRHDFDSAAGAHLTPQRFPVKRQSRL